MKALPVREVGHEQEAIARLRTRTGSRSISVQVRRMFTPEARKTVRTILLGQASTRNSRSMPNLYFCESEDQSRGMLRAVLSWEDCNRVVQYGSAIHLGDEFPSGPINGSCRSTVAILYVRPEEASEEWGAGFYRIDLDVTEIAEALQMVAGSLLTAHPLHKAVTQG